MTEKEAQNMSKKKMTKRQRRRIRQRNRRILLFVTGLLLVGAIFFGILMLFGNKDKANSDKKSGNIIGWLYKNDIISINRIDSSKKLEKYIVKDDELKPIRALYNLELK